MQNDRDQSAADLRQYQEEDRLNSPIGHLRVCLHLPSGQRRGLKVMRSNLADRKQFFTWYAAGLTLAGRAAEQLQLPHLLAPVRTPDDKYFSVRAGEHIVERPFFGSDELPAFNLDQFIEQYRRDGPGLPEKVALAIIREIVEPLTVMHETRMPDVEGVRLEGIPHLNLKPQNVIIGKHPRSHQWTVRLTDFLIAMASPTAEEAGIIVPLNYSYDRVLEDPLYFGRSADIVSCGLLLYRMLEYDDLIPVSLGGRKSIIDFIQNELPTRLHHLTLTNASRGSRQIIQRCLLPNKGERYMLIKELKHDLDKALGRETPADVIGQHAEEVPAATVSNGPTRPDFRRYAIYATAAVVTVMVIWFGWSQWRKHGIRSERDDVTALLDEVKQSGILSWGFANSLQERLTTINEKLDHGDWRDARYELRQMLHTLDQVNLYGDSVVSLSAVAKGQQTRNELDVACAQLIQRKLGDARRATGAGDIKTADLYVGDAAKLIRDGCGEPCDETAAVRELDALVNQVGAPCRRHADRIRQEALAACRQSDGRAFEERRTQLRQLANDPNCRE